MIRGEIEESEEVGSDDSLLYIGDCKVVLERLLANLNRMFGCAITFNVCSIRCLQCYAIRSSDFVSCCRGNDGDNCSSIDEPFQSFNAVSDMKKESRIASYSIHVTYCLLALAFP